MNIDITSTAPLNKTTKLSERAKRDIQNISVDEENFMGPPLIDTNDTSMAEDILDGMADDFYSSESEDDDNNF